jgi:hypothetical protein
MKFKERIEDLKKQLHEFRAEMRDKEKRSDMGKAFFSGFSKGLIRMQPYFSLAGVVYFLMSPAFIHKRWIAAIWTLLFLAHLHTKHYVEKRDRMFFEQTTMKEVAMAAASFVGKQLQHAVQNGYRPPADTQFPGKRGKMDS